jgi:Flp pilus assembly protein TadD
MHDLAMSPRLDVPSLVTVLQKPDLPQIQQMNAAMGLLRNGALPEALALARQLVSANAKDVEARQLLAICLARTGSVVEAEREFTHALQLAPDHPHVLSNLAALLRSAGRVHEAIPLWRRATAANPGHLQAWMDLGAAELSIDHHREAAAAFERALALQPSARAWHYLGNARRAGGELVLAEAAFRNAIALDPRSASAFVNLGAVLRLLGRASEAIPCYEHAQALGYHGPEVRDALVGALTDTGRIADAMSRARRLVAEHPTFAAGHRTLASLLWEYGPTLDVVEDPFAIFAAAADAQPENPALQTSYIALLLEANKAEEAAVRAEHVRNRSDSPLLMRMHADALARTGRAENANALYVSLLDGGECSPDFLNAYTRHLLVSGEWKSAAERARDVLQQDPGNQQALAHLATAWRLLGDEREFWLCDYERLIQPIDMDAPPGFASTEEFLGVLNATLDELHLAAREPIPESVRGGSQTPGQLFGRTNPVIESTAKLLQDTVGRWLSELPIDGEHPFLRRKAPRTRYAGSWSVKLRAAGRHVNHVHSQGWISSAFYVKLPPSMLSAAESSTAGCIQFGQPPLDMGLGLPPRRVLRPRPGRLVLFPSYMWHGTVPFDDAEPRVTVAFDLVPSP